MGYENEKKDSNPVPAKGRVFLNANRWLMQIKPLQLAPEHIDEGFPVDNERALTGGDNEQI